MEYRFLGNSGLKVSVLSLGGWLTYGGSTDFSTTAECMKVAYDNGINFFDTAEVYAGGESEKAMGLAIKKYGWRRSSFVISTKLYWSGGAAGTTNAISITGVNDRGLSRKHVIEGMKGSLERLQLEYVDLIYAHRPDNFTPMEEIVRAFNWLIEQGYAFYWGTSEWSAEQITDAFRVAEKLNLIPPLMEQPQYNMLERTRFEKEYAPLYKKYKYGTTIWSPLASGMLYHFNTAGILTGKYNKEIPSESRLAIKGNFIVDGLKKMLQTEEGRKKLQIVSDLEVFLHKNLAYCERIRLHPCTTCVGLVLQESERF